MEPKKIMDLQNQPDILSFADKIIKWGGIVATTLIGLLVFIYRSKIKDLEDKIATEKLEREKEIKAMLELIKEFRNDRELVEKELLVTFKEGIKEEREFRTSVMISQGGHIENIFEKLKEVSICVGRLEERLINNIANQEKICELHHPTHN